MLTMNSNLWNRVFMGIACHWYLACFIQRNLTTIADLLCAYSNIRAKYHRTMFIGWMQNTPSFLIWRHLNCLDLLHKLSAVIKMEYNEACTMLCLDPHTYTASTFKGEQSHYSHNRFSSLLRRVHKSWECIQHRAIFRVKAASWRKWSKMFQCQKNMQKEYEPAGVSQSSEWSHRRCSTEFILISRLSLLISRMKTQLCTSWPQPHSAAVNVCLLSSSMQRNCSLLLTLCACTVWCRFKRPLNSLQNRKCSHWEIV